ncbi:hypothetical protein B0H14DRAFT_3606055 [Mycena olivaceomarginata]|nr:hypothetical protein B0H14DRAFT_3606055 [Mycena olivaceomarginata]
MLSSLLVFGAALITVNARFPTPRTPPQVIFQSSVSLENIAMRASSDLLLTSFTSPTLFTFDPKSTNGTLAPVHTFSNATTLTGITDTMNLGSVFLWSIDFNARTPAVSVLGALPGSSGANGITTVSGHPNILLVADSFVGAIWQLDIATGAARLAIQDPALSAGAPPPAVGVNAVFGRVGFRVEGGNVSAAGAVQTLASLGDGQQPDDFVFDCEGAGVGHRASGRACGFGSAWARERRRLDASGGGWECGGE